MRGRRGRPSLVGTMARTAVIAGTASTVSGSVHQKQAAAAQQSQQAQAADQQQQQMLAQQQAQIAQQQAQLTAQQQAAATPPAPAAPAPAAAGDDIIASLERLGALHTQGLLTDDEFSAAKAKLLG